MNFLPGALNIRVRGDPAKQIRGGTLGGPDDVEVGHAAQTSAVIPARVLALVCELRRLLGKEKE